MEKYKVKSCMFLLGKSRLLVLLSLFLTISIRAQVPSCGTELTQAHIDYIEQNREVYERFELSPEMSRSINRIPIQVHIMRRSDASGGIDLKDIQDAVDRTNDFYRSANIEFFISDSPNYVDNDAYFNLVPPYESFMNWSEHESPTKVNAFFFNRITYPGQSTDNGVGIGLFPSLGNAIYMQNEATVNLHSLLAHELGHYFDLLHTHETATGEELVTRGNGRNCEDAGDLLCDTPADPYLGWDSGRVQADDCTYDSQDRDANGQLYNPLTNNIMSYSPYPCITTFTDDQRERIQATLAGPRSYLLEETNSLDCEAALPISVGEVISGSTIGKQNNQESYVINTSSRTIETGEIYQGPEAIYKFYWPGGRISAYLDIKPHSGEYPDLDMIVLSDCQNSESGIDASTRVQTSDPSSAFERTRPYLEPGNYYLVIDGFEGASGSFDLTLDNHGLDCSDIVPLSLNDPYSGDTRDKEDRALVYCSDSSDPDQKHSGPEVVHEINWPGGDFTATLDITEEADQSYPDLDLILLRDCSDLTNCVDAKYGTGSQEKIERPNLPAGTYYLVVDGKLKLDEEGKPIQTPQEGAYTLTVEGEEQKLDCANALDLQHLVKTSGSFTNATNNVSDYGGGENFTGREVVYKIDLPSTIWLADHVYFDLTGDAEKVILLDNCDPIDTGQRPYIVDKGIGGLITGVGPGTYYVVVEGPLDGSDGNFELTVRRDHLRCSDARPITIGQAIGPGPFSPYTYVNNYCGDPNSTSLEGREAIFELEWPGGDFKATLSDMMINSSASWDDAAMILLKDCEDPASCVGSPVINNGASELVMEHTNLPEGKYFVVVDGKIGIPIPLDFKLTVEGEDPKPDYAVTDVSIDRDPIIPGEDFYVTYTIENIGTVSGGRFQFMQYLSRDERLDDTEDIKLKDFPVDPLDPGQIYGGVPGKRNIDAETESGVYYLITAVRDQSGNDANENNNTRAIPVRVGADQKPDYQPTVMTGPATASPGQSITMQVTLKNNGDDLGPNDDITNGKDKYYISNRSDLMASNLNTQAIFLKDYPTDDIAAGETKNYPGGFSIPPSLTTGSYFIYFFHDADNKIDEYNEDNNVIFWPITIEANTPKPDLIVTAFSTDTDPIIPGEPFRVDYTIANQGNANAPASKLAYYLSTNSTLDLGEDELIISFNSSPVAAGSEYSANGNRTIQAGTSPGTYYLLMYIDANDNVDESNENNNIKAIQVTVGDTQKPDYQPTDFVARGGATTLQAGGTIVIDLKIKNNGPVDGEGNGGKDIYYLSRTRELSGIISPFSNEHFTADIPAGVSWPVNSGPLTIPANTNPGTYYILFHHDADNKVDESNEDNNIAYLEITVMAPGSGLDVDFTADKSSVCAGESVQFTAQISVGSGSQEVVYDQSGNGNSGQLFNLDENSFIENSGYGKALILTGNENYIELPENLTANMDNFTYEARFFYEENGIFQRLLDFGNSRSENMYLTPNNFFGKVDFGIKKFGVEKSMATEAPLTTNQWYHIALTIDENKHAKLYIDGELKKEEILPLKVSDLGNLSENWIGKSRSDNAYLKGKLDEVRIWSTARTQAEIEANKDQELIGNEPGLVVYYDFNQEVGHVTYNWVFEGGTPASSNTANPSVSYPNAGTYPVSLTVTSGGQTASEVKEGFITAEDCNGLVVDFSADPTDPCVGQTVQFTSTIDDVQSNDLAYYPLLTNLNDATGNNGTVSLSGNNPPSPPSIDNPLCINGIFIDQLLATPVIAGFDPTNFTISVEFKLNQYGTRDEGAPVIVGGNFRSIAIYVEKTGKAGILYNNDKYKFSNTIINLNQWYKGEIKFQNNTTELYIDDILVLSENTGILNYSTYNFQTSHRGTGATLNGCIRNLRIGGTSSPSNSISYNWSFPGGTPSFSTEANPTVTYASPGTYNVSLTVDNGNTSKTETKSGYITVQGCEPTWSVTETGDNHTVIIRSNANITLDGQSIAVGDYIGAFYNDNGTLRCAGKAKWTGQNISVIVYGDDLTTNAKEGFGAGESFQWKLWKASTNRELYGVATYDVPSGIITHTGQFAVNGVSRISRITGTIQPPQTADQTLTLQPGWNLISSYIKANARDMAAIFDPIKANIAIVKNGTGDIYMPTSAINDIGNWNVVDGYQVKVLGSSPVQLTLTGEKADLARTTIAFSEGFNLFAFLKESEQAVETVMAPVASEVEVIKDVSGRVYIPSESINNIGNMKPGQGYWAKMKAAANLNYNARMATPPANMHMAQITPNRYSIERRGTHNATMILDTKGLVELGDEIGVFDMEGELVGAATYEDHILAFSIWGDDPTTSEIDGLEEGATFEIRVWNKAMATEMTFDFSANVDLYTTHGVIQAELLRTTATPSLLEANSLKLYPNPTHNNATLRLALTSQATVKATLFDLTGKHMLNISNEKMPAGTHQLKISTSSLPSGLYHCRILVDGVIHNIPFSVVK